MISVQGYDMKEKRSFLRDIFGYSISSWVNVIIGMLYTVLSTRILTPDIYGSISLFMNSSEAVMYLICLGLDASFIRFFHERPNDESKELFQTKLIFLVTINLLFVYLIFTLLFFEKINSIMFGKTSWLLTVLLFVSSYTQLLLRFLNISYRMSFNIKKFTIQNILIQSSTKILVLIAACFSPNFEFIITTQVIGITVVAITYVFLQRKFFTGDVLDRNGVCFRENLVAYLPVIKFALCSAPVYITSYFNIVVLQNIIKIILGVNSLGIYSSVSIFGALFSSTISKGFSTFWSAYVYKNYNNDNRRIKEMSNYIVLVGLVSMALFVLFKDALYIFIGDEYQSGIVFFTMILSVNVVDLLSQAGYYGIDIAKKNYITAITTSIYVALNALCVYYSAIYFGLVGVAFSVMLIKVILFYVNTLIAQRFYRSIDNMIRFSIGMLLILLIAILPALGLDKIYIDFAVFSLLVLSTIVFNKQYKRVFQLFYSRFA